MFKNQLTVVGGTWFVVCADPQGAHSPTTAGFRLPVWCHQFQNWERCCERILSNRTCWFQPSRGRASDHTLVTKIIQPGYLHISCPLSAKQKMTVSKCHEVFCVGFLMASEIDLDFRMQARFEKQKVLGKKKDKLISFSNSPSLKLKCNRFLHKRIS